MKHRYVWADTPLLRGASTLPLFQCKASHSLDNETNRRA